MLKRGPKSPRTHFAHCHIHERLELVRWVQRGITHPEWIRVCPDAERLIFKQTRRHPKPKNQLDLFAK